MGILIDGYDIDSNLSIKARRGVGQWKDLTQARDQVVNLPMRDGGVDLTGRRDTEKRTITVPMILDGDSKSDAKSKLDEFKFRVSKETITVEFPDENREFDAKVKSLNVSTVEPDFASRSYEFEVEFLLEDPRLFDTSTTTVDFSGSATETPLGNVRVWPTITIEETTAPYTITYKDASGNTVASIAFGTGLGAGEQRIINMDKFTVEDSNGNNKISEMSGGDFFALDPRHGEWNGPYPTLEIDTSPTVADADYKKAWS